MKTGYKITRFIVISQCLHLNKKADHRPGIDYLLSTVSVVCYFQWGVVVVFPESHVGKNV